MLDFLQKQKIVNENFWSILIEQEWVDSAIWQIIDGKVEIVCSSPATRWESDLVEAIDTSLSTCTQSLSDEDQDPSKTVFGLPNSWLLDGNIKEEYLSKLKKICEDLSLVPSGFVVISEAISHYIKHEEEVSLTGIILGISNENLELSIFNTGKLIGSTNISRSISIEDDLIEGFSRLGTNLDNFPSRLILFNQKERELEDTLNTLNESDWEKIGASKFIHTPKIEIFAPDKKILAISLAGGTELGVIDGIVVKTTSELDVETDIEELPTEELENIKKTDDLTAEGLGFVQKEDFVVSDQTTNEHPRLTRIPKFSFKRPNIKLPSINMNLGQKPLIIGSFVLIAIFILGFVLWWILPKATVTIYVESKKIEDNIFLDLTDDLDSKNVNVSVSGEKTKSTTGTKVVGEKAKGSIKLQNGTAFPINLPIGSVLVSSTDLKYVTLKAASISGALSPTNPGNTTIDVEANNIGSEYNLAKDEIFKVGNYPKAEVDGVSINSFSGGSSRQISAVSKDDLNTLSDDLTKELEEEAKQKLLNSVSDDEYLIESLLNTTVEKEDFSNKVGDEATTIRLSITLDVLGQKVSKKDLSTFAKKSLDSKVPVGFVLRDEQLTYEFKPGDEKGSNIKIVANLLPNINPSEISSKIAGKYPKFAESYLASIPGFVKAEFRLKPFLPGKFGTLPHLSKNLSVEFSTAR